jgi:LPS-assembly protein
VAAGNRKKKRERASAAALALAAIAFALPFSATALAQTASPTLPSIPENAKLLLTASELVYDRDGQKIMAIGGVQINYGGYKLVAKKVEYNQATGRMTAFGDIELVEPTGNRLYADTLDVTDDFARGFIKAIRIETTDNTRLAGESAERIDSETTVLNKGLYTACEPCKDHPERPPTWQIKAEKVVENGKTRTIRMEKARFELFGAPIAYIPVLELPDHTVKRKSGFLFPMMSSSENLGFGVSIPYYHVISPTMDATITAKGYSSQGLVLEAEFRQRLANGTYQLTIAGISQMTPSNFDAGTSDAMEKNRGMIASKGEFKINPKWTFGWDVMAQTDNNFARTYTLMGTDALVHTNQAYLTGLGHRNSFDMRSFYFDVQDADPKNAAEHRQAIVHPVIDYRYFHPAPVAGGELSATVNVTSLTRTSTDHYNMLRGLPVTDRWPGLGGTSNRFTTEMEWKRTFVAPGGLLLTPILVARGDGLQLQVNDPAGPYAGDFYNGDTASRTMLTAGLEARYPFLITTGNSSHVIEPIAQIYARPDETLAGRLPNEDAQSFVFDATNLFERDKFSGFDRIEGGTRANVGLRYTGSFDAGYTVRGIIGQSFQLAGQNSFATPDLVNAGANSGLETAESDYVGMAGVDLPNGLSLAWGERLDETSLKIRRSDATLAYTSDFLEAGLIYTQIDAQPKYGFPTANDEIQALGSVKLRDYWSVFGAVTWDLNNEVLSRRGVGFTFDDSCTIFTMAFAQKRDAAGTSASDWEIGARLSFRTLGDIKVGDTTLPGFE